MSDDIETNDEKSAILKLIEHLTTALNHNTGVLKKVSDLLGNLKKSHDKEDVGSSAHLKSNSIEGKIDQIASTFERALEFFIKDRKKNSKFYKSPSFWTACMVALTAAGLFVTVQIQVKAMMVKNLNTEVQAVDSVISKEKAAIINARMVIQNQLVDCPTTNLALLKRMKKARNNSIVGITDYDSGLDFPTSDRAKKILYNITSQIFSIKTTQICKLNPQQIDDSLRKHGTHALNILLAYKAKKARELRNLQSSIMLL